MTTMTGRQRYLETLLFGKPDRIPLVPGAGRESTRARWMKEGLPKPLPDNLTSVPEYAYRLAGGTLAFPKSGPEFKVTARMVPEFEEKVLEEKEDSLVVQDWKGNICEIGKEFTVEYLRNARDFVTRRWIKCPVENRADWESMKKRYNPEDPVRLSQQPEALKPSLENRENFVSFSFSGPYWQLREWLGFEGLSVMFYDDPGLVGDMIAFWRDYIDRLMKIAFQYCVPDCVLISEDMAYKSYSMVSPAMAREFLQPCWKAWGETIRNAGVPIYAVDSDGYIGELIPLWIESGVNVCDPIEVAAGNDIVAFRKRFGKAMAYRGGVDKREMAKGGVHIEKEMERLAPVVRSGGFIPGCDHAVPSDVSWPDYVYYVKLLARQCGWL